jgi:hypothetical protein
MMGRINISRDTYPSPSSDAKVPNNHADPIHFSARFFQIGFLLVWLRKQLAKYLHEFECPSQLVLLPFSETQKL